MVYDVLFKCLCIKKLAFLFSMDSWERRMKTLRMHNLVDEYWVANDKYFGTTQIMPFPQYIWEFNFLNILKNILRYLHCALRGFV